MQNSFEANLAILDSKSSASKLLGEYEWDVEAWIRPQKRNISCKYIGGDNICMFLRGEQVKQEGSGAVEGGTQKPNKSTFSANGRHTTAPG